MNEQNYKKHLGEGTRKSGTLSGYGLNSMSLKHRINFFDPNHLRFS